MVAASLVHVEKQANGGVSISILQAILLVPGGETGLKQFNITYPCQKHKKIAASNES